MTPFSPNDLAIAIIEQMTEEMCYIYYSKCNNKIDPSYVIIDAECNLEQVVKRALRKVSQ